MKKEFLMWGRQGLLTAFLLDLTDASQAIMTKFLKSIEFASDNKEIPRLKPAKRLCLMYPDMGSWGFGRPDGLMMLSAANGRKKTVFIINAIGDTYSNASKAASLRGTEGFDRAINGRVELAYNLAQALSAFKTKDKQLSDPYWVVNTPYNLDRLGILRTVDNPEIIKNVVRPMAGQKINSYCELIITTDRSNPLGGDYNLPELFDAQGSDAWGKLGRNVGWLSFQKMEELAAGFKTSARFPRVMQLNRNSLKFKTDTPMIVKGGPAKGASVIFAPDIDPGGLLHFTWQNETAVLRKYADPKKPPVIDRKRKTSAVRKRIKVEILPEQKKPVAERAFWHQYIAAKESWHVAGLFEELAGLAELSFDSQVTVRVASDLQMDRLAALALAGLRPDTKLVQKFSPRRLKKSELPDLAPTEGRFPIGCSVLDLLGEYDPLDHEITVYDTMCRLIAAEAGLDPEQVLQIVFAHQAGHAVTHLGRDADGNQWKGYIEASSKDRELFAQIYPILKWRSRGDKELESAFRELSKAQSPTYNLWGEYLYVALSVVNEGLQTARHTPTHSMEILVHSYDGRSPWSSVQVLTNDGRAFTTRFEGLDWQNLGVTDYLMAPYIVSRATLDQLKDYIVSNDVIYVPGGIMQNRVRTAGERSSVTIQVKVDNMLNEWTGVAKHWGEYAQYFKQILEYFQEALREATG